MTQPVIAQAVTAPPVSEPIVAQVAPPASVSSPANFALQLVSITERHLLPHVWQEMREKTPQLLADMEPNFQKINVRNTDYYRLKVGGFTTRNEANQKCTDLKSAGISCLVVDYTASNFLQLTNQPGA
jgi:cell division septation protein DedD